MAKNLSSNELNAFISELTQVSEYKTQLYSLLIPLILSKKFFKKGAELREFVEHILSLQLANYVYKSRTILIGRICRYINSLEISEVVEIYNRVSDFIHDVAHISDRKDNEKATPTNSKFFSAWSEYISQGFRKEDENDNM